MIRKYRKRPVVIEAFGPLTEDNLKTAAIWCGGVVAYGSSIFIDTMEGTMQACLGDYIIRGVAGETYPCKPDIFDKTYEPTEEWI